MHSVRGVLTAATDDARNMRQLGAAIAHHGENPLRWVIYTESHDEIANGRTRLPEEIWLGNAGSWFSRKRSTLGAALVFTAPGIPMIFQGQEFLESHWFHDEVPIDWTRLRTYAGIQAMYRDLIRLRRNWHDTTRGLRDGHVNVHHLNDDDNVIAYHRWHHGGPRDDVVVLLNVANRAYDSYWIGLPRSGEWRESGSTRLARLRQRFRQPGQLRHDDRPRDGMPWSASVGIGPYAALVLSQDR